MQVPLFTSLWFTPYPI